MVANIFLNAHCIPFEHRALPHLCIQHIFHIPTHTHTHTHTHTRMHTHAHTCMHTHAHAHTRNILQAGTSITFIQTSLLPILCILRASVLLVKKKERKKSTSWPPAWRINSAHNVQLTRLPPTLGLLPKRGNECCMLSNSSFPQAPPPSFLCCRSCSSCRRPLEMTALGGGR